MLDHGTAGIPTPPAPASRTVSPAPLAYLFERFPAFTQTFCAREVLAMERQGWAPVVFSIRDPRERGEPAPDFLPAEVRARVRYLPGEKEIIDEVRWLRRHDRLPGAFAAAEPGWRTAPDKGRFYEAALLAWRLGEAGGLRHVHVHFAGLAARTAYWLQRYGGITYSLTGHANDLFRPGDPDDAPAPGRVLAAACFVVTESEFAAARMRARHPDLAGLFCPVPNGLDVAAFPVARPAENPPRVLAVGRLIEKKGFADLIAALAQLRARGTEFAAEIVGDGPLRGELAAAIEAAGLADVVTLPGALPQREVMARLADARVFALPCVEESDGAGGMDNFPTVIAEAMAAGLPVVSTTTAGVPEMVVDGETGRLVPPRAPGALADALGPLLADGALAASLGAAGRRRAEEQFSVDVSAGQLTRLLVERTALPPRPSAPRRGPGRAWREFWREQRGPPFGRNDE